MNFQTEKPTASGLYLVDREKQGRWYRHYNAETDTWSLCGETFEDATAYIGQVSPIGPLPWVGPLTGPKYPKAVEPVEKTKKAEKVKPARKAASKKSVTVNMSNTTAKPAKAVKQTQPDGTIFFREDRQKWVVIIDNKQPAARPTADGCVKWLEKKFPNITPNIIK